MQMENMGVSKRSKNNRYIWQHTGITHGALQCKNAAIDVHTYFETNMHICASLIGRNSSSPAAWGLRKRPQWTHADVRVDLQVGHAASAPPPSTSSCSNSLTRLAAMLDYFFLFFLLLLVFSVISVTLPDWCDWWRWVRGRGRLGPWGG